MCKALTENLKIPPIVNTLTPCLLSHTDAHTQTRSHPTSPLRFIEAKATTLNPSAPHCHLHFMPPGFFLKWQYFDAVRGTHYHYFNFRGNATQHCGKQQRVGVTRCWFTPIHGMAMASTHLVCSSVCAMCLHL